MSVYPVREDTLLVKENLEEKDLEGVKFLEVGVGNAELSITAAKKGAEVTAVDINGEAVQHSQKRFYQKEFDAEVFQSNLFEEVNQKFDLIVFNPPYLPGPKGIGDEEIWRGGQKGVEIPRKYLEEVSKYLNTRGKALLVLSSNTRFRSLEKRYELKEIDREKLWFETIYLFEFE